MFTASEKGLWMLRAMDGNGYCAMTRPARYECYETFAADGDTEITPSQYEAFVAQVLGAANTASQKAKDAQSAADRAEGAAGEAQKAKAAAADSVQQAKGEAESAQTAAQQADKAAARAEGYAPKDGTVLSVNGKGGAVRLNAADVGAMAADREDLVQQVVLEGRKVVNNVTRTAAVFFIKTIYSVLVSFFCLALNVPFPFIPIQITLVDACIEAWPSFLTIFESDTRRIRGRFLPTALGKAAPFAIVVTGMIIAFSLIAPFGETQNRTVMFALLVAASMVAVIKSCVPFTKIRVFVCVTMVLGAPFALLILPHLFEVVAMTGPIVVMMAVTAAIIAAQRAWLRSRR